MILLAVQGRAIWTAAQVIAVCRGWWHTGHWAWCQRVNFLSFKMLRSLYCDCSLHVYLVLDVAINLFYIGKCCTVAVTVQNISSCFTCDNWVNYVCLDQGLHRF